MKIGFDIDDTLINLREHAFHLYNKKLGKNVPIEIFHNLNKVEIHEPFGLTDQAGNDMWKNNAEEIYFTTCPPFPDVIEKLQQLEKEHHEIYYITSRPMEHCERTRQWMKDAGFPVEDSRFFCGMKDEEKIDIIKRLRLDYYFDDKPEVLNTLLHETETKVYVKDQSYNRHLKLPRIVDWKDMDFIPRKKI